MMTLPVLWHFPISHFNEKARWALDFKGIPHVRRALFLSYLPRALWATGKPTLPVLILDGQAIGDSTRIIEALERYRPDPALYPSDPPSRRRALDLEDFFDEELGHPLRALVLGDTFTTDPAWTIATITVGMRESARRTLQWMLPVFRPFYKWRHNINAATIADAQAKVLAALDRIEAELEPSGYLVGDHFSVADLTACALLSPLVRPAAAPYLSPEPLPEIFVRFRDSVATRAAFRWVADVYNRHRGVSSEVVT